MDKLTGENRTGKAHRRESLAGERGILFPPFRLDPKNEQLWRDDELVALKPRPFAVLLYLVERQRRLVKKEELLSQLWNGVTVGEAVLKTCLSEIRQALGDSARSPRFIETAHGRGYRFIGPVEPANAPAISTRPVELQDPGGPSFVGREGELRVLDEMLERAVSGQRQVIFVTGEPGIGKTRLVNAFLERARSRDALFISVGQCIDQYGKGEPYMPVLEALDNLCRGPDAEEVVGVLRRMAPSWLLQMPGLSPGPQESSTAQVLPSAAPGRMLREMAETLEALSEKRAVILVFEDLHWADYSTLDLISYIARRSPRAALLVVGTYRPLDVSPSSAHRSDVLYELPLRTDCQELRLSHLDERAIAEYLGRRFPARDLPPQLSQMLRVRTTGNPLFICRVVDGWVENGVLDQQGGCATLSQLSRDVPESILRILHAEFERLIPFEQDVLQAASAAGMEFSMASVAAALQDDILRVEELCMRWARAGRFLRVTGTSEWPDGTVQIRCQFTHALYHQVFYERLGPSLRAQLHQRIGERLEIGYGKWTGSVAPELAVHFENARDYPRAVRYLRIAGEQALVRGAYREATDHLERALSLLPKLPSSPESLVLELELCIPLGTALGSTKGYAAPEVERIYARARELCDVVGQTPCLFPVLAGMISFYLVRADHRTTGEVAEHFVRLARAQSGDGVQSVAHMTLGYNCFHRSRLAEARYHLELAVALHKPEHGDFPAGSYKHAPEAAARAELSHVLWTSGYPDQALRAANEALARAKRLGDPFTLALVLHFCSALHAFRRDIDHSSRQHAEALVTLATEHGLVFFQALGRLLHGDALAELGDLDAGLAIMRRGWTEYQATGAEAGGTYFRSRLSVANARAGHHDEAFRLLDEGFLAARRNEELWCEPELYRLWGELLASTKHRHTPMPRTLTEDMPTTPRACFLRALQLSKQRGAKALELRAAKSLLVFADDCAEVAAARSQLLEITSWFTEGLETTDLLEAREMLRSDAP